MTAVHEGFHVLQYRDLGVGVGFFRGFMLYYLSEYLQLFFKNIKNNSRDTANQIAYEKHPMEVPVFAYEAAFTQYAIAQKGIIHTDAIPPEFIRNTCDYKPKISLLYLLMGTSITFIFMLLKPFVELCFLLLAAPIYFLGKLLAIMYL